jgi:hypothetical protein
MRQGGGKAKGGSFERVVCKQLSLWLSQGARDDLLWRSAMSGGRATIQLRAGKVNLTQGGDVSAVGQGGFAFCEQTFIECKAYTDLQFGRSLVVGTGILARFWETAVKEAAKYGKRPLLIAKQNLYPVLALTNMQRPYLWADPILTLHHWPTPARVYLFNSVMQQPCLIGKVRRPLP